MLSVCDQPDSRRLRPKNIRMIRTALNLGNTRLVSDLDHRQYPFRVAEDHTLRRSRQQPSSRRPDWDGRHHCGSPVDARQGLVAAVRHPDAAERRNEPRAGFLSDFHCRGDGVRLRVQFVDRIFRPVADPDGILRNSLPVGCALDRKDGNRLQRGHLTLDTMALTPDGAGREDAVAQVPPALRATTRQTGDHTRRDPTDSSYTPPVRRAAAPQAQTRDRCRPRMYSRFPGSPCELARGVNATALASGAISVSRPAHAAGVVENAREPRTVPTQDRDDGAGALALAVDSCNQRNDAPAKTMSNATMSRTPGRALHMRPCCTTAWKCHQPEQPQHTGVVADVGPTAE